MHRRICSLLLILVPFVLLPILLVMMVWLFVSSRKRKK